ncbi:MAG: DUF2339 domain-containing protein [Phycisphaerales bacterium]
MSSGQDPRIDELLERLARLERFVGLPPPDRSKPAGPLQASSLAPPDHARPNDTTPEPVLNMSAATIRPLPGVSHAGPRAPESAAQSEPHPAEADAPPRDAVDPQVAEQAAKLASASLHNADLAEAVARGEQIAPDPDEDVRHHPIEPDELRRAASSRVREHLRERASLGLTKSMADMERLIGGRWYAVVGAVVLVIGVGMGLKWAYDAGLLRMPPAFRCLSGGAFGVALLAAGQWLRKKVNDWAAVGATAAGLGSMYVSVLAAYKLFTLLPPAAAFAMLAGVSMLGIVISIRSRLAAVGIASLVAAYITPVMFLDVSSSPIRFALYLIMLLLTGLGVSAWQGRALASLRTLSWSGTLLWGSAWSLRNANSDFAIVLVFLAMVWAMLHAELLWSAKRQQLQLPTASDPDAPPPDDPTRFRRWSTWRPVTISISATFWCVTLGYMVLRANLWSTWPASAAALVACGAIWLLAASHLDVIRQRPTNDLEVLGVVAAIQIGAMILATIALAFGGPAQVVTWLLLAVAAAATSQRLNARAIFFYAIIPALIATLRLLVWDSWQGVWHSGGYHVLGLQLTPWSLLVLGASAAWRGISRFTPATERAWPRAVFSALALVLLMATPLHPQSKAMPIAGVWLVIALCVGVYLYTRSRREPWRLVFAAVPLSLATMVIVSHAPVLSGSGGGVFLLGLRLTPWTGFMIGASVAWAAIGTIAIRFLPRATLLGTAIVVMLLLMAAPANPLSERVSLAAFWLGLALFVAVMARSPRLGLPTVFFFSLLPAVLAAGALISARPEADAAALASASRVLGLHFETWSWMLIAGGAAWLGLATLTPRETDERIPPGMAIVAMFLVMLAAFDPRTTHLAQWSWWFVWSVAPGLARPLLPRMRLIFAAVVGAVMCTGLWIVLFVPHWTKHESPLLLHPGLVTGLLLTAQWGLSAAWLRHEGRSAASRQSSVVVGLAALFACTSLEAARIALRISDDPAARGAGVSLWWGVFAAGLLVAGFWRRSSPLRWGGLILLGVTSLKLVIIDLATVPMLWRTISFLALGLLMIGVPVAYARLGKRESETIPTDPPPTELPSGDRDSSTVSDNQEPQHQPPPNS